MKALITFFLLVGLTATAQARDDTLYLPIANALNAAQAAGKIDGGVKFYFGDQQHADIERSFGEYSTNKKTNAVGKSDATACEWAMQSALIVLYNRAISEGGNAVVNVHSYYKKNVYSDSKKYECHAGAVVAGVALRGTVAKLKP